MQSPIYSVSQLNQTVKLLLEQQIGHIWLSGEITNCTSPRSGHWYFSLKDDQAQVRCVMFRYANQRCTFKIENGQQVLLKAAITVYEARGDYQLIVDIIKLDGAGLLQQRFEQLKQKLMLEGLFDSQYKKALPDCQTVGLITSASGAVLHDILHILEKRDPNIKIIIYPTLVQGNDAALDIVRKIHLANKRNECDVLILARGGGTLEDLWCFNEESVARAIFESQLPIVSAIGHETDVTIADFVADVRAPTPSGAAMLISKDKNERVQKVLQVQQRLSLAIDYFIANKKQALTSLVHQLTQLHPQVKLAKQSHELTLNHQRLVLSINHYLKRHQNILSAHKLQLLNRSPKQVINQQIQLIEKKNFLIRSLFSNTMNQYQKTFQILSSQLNSVSPLATINRGYSITQDKEHKPIKTLSSISMGDTLFTRFADGELESLVTNIKTLKNLEKK